MSKNRYYVTLHFDGYKELSVYAENEEEAYELAAEEMWGLDDGDWEVSGKEIHVEEDDEED